MNWQGLRAVCERSQRGLFAGVKTIFGNRVSHSNRKTRRRWLPNVQRKRLFSVALNCWIPLNVTTKALRCIDKCGGLDSYILDTPEDKLKSRKAMELRFRILNRDREIEEEEEEVAVAVERGGGVVPERKLE